MSKLNVIYLEGVEKWFFVASRTMRKFEQIGKCQRNSDDTPNNKKHFYLTPYICNEQMFDGQQFALNKTFLSKRLMRFVAY